MANFGLSDDDSFFASVFFELCFDVPKSARDGESAGEDSAWAEEDLLLRALGVFRRKWRRDRGNRLRLIDFATFVDNAGLLYIFVWFVVTT